MNAGSVLDYVRTLSLTCRISLGSPYNDAGDKQSIAFALSLYFWPLLRVLALISTTPILSERSVRTGKTGSGNDNNIRHCPIITCRRCSCFFRSLLCGWPCSKY
ncbi:hypothetical protein ACNKHM_24160 [Shigella sonnei]